MSFLASEIFLFQFFLYLCNQLLIYELLRYETISSCVIHFYLLVVDGRGSTVVDG